MAAQDVAEADNSAQEALEPVNQYIVEDIKAREAARKKGLEKLIDIRAQELLFVHGWKISEADAKRQAKSEISGYLAFEDEAL